MAIARVDFNTFENGEQYQARLIEESESNFKVLASLLSSYWQSRVDGPQYAREMKAMAISLARLRLSLEDIRVDTQYETTRPEFLYQIITSVVFPDGSPDTDKSDIDFREFLLDVIEIYFKGSIPDSMKKAVEIFISGGVTVRENFNESRVPGSGFDISDEFGFDIDVNLPDRDSLSKVLLDRNVRKLLDIIRPAHTLYRIKYIITDKYDPILNPETAGQINDSLSISIKPYSYEDFRKFIDGIDGIDKFGSKSPITVIGEVHTQDF
jgi:hypothetical protein